MAFLFTPVVPEAPVPSVEQRVQNGIAWLNTVARVGWEREVVTDYLDISDCQWCVAAQALDMSFVLVRRRCLHDTFNSNNASAYDTFDRWAEHHGFLPTSSNYREHVSALNTEWKRQLILLQDACTM